MRRLLLKLLFAVSIVLASSAGASDEPSEKPGTNQDEKKKRSSEDRNKEDKRREEFHKLTPEQKEAKRNEFKARLEKRLSELRCKQTNGTINGEEARELLRREQILKRFQQWNPGKTNAPAAPKG